MFLTIATERLRSNDAPVPGSAPGIYIVVSKHHSSLKRSRAPGEMADSMDRIGNE